MCDLSCSSAKAEVRLFRLTSLRQGYGGPPKREGGRRKAEATNDTTLAGLPLRRHDARLQLRVESALSA
jgi:hypothetical protein